MSQHEITDVLMATFAQVQDDALEIVRREPVRLNAVVALRQAHPYVPLRMACVMIDASRKHA